MLSRGDGRSGSAGLGQGERGAAWFGCVLGQPAETPRVFIRWIMEKAREFQKNIYFCFMGRGFSAPHCGAVPRRQLMTPGGWAPSLWVSWGLWTGTTTMASLEPAASCPAAATRQGLGVTPGLSAGPRDPEDPLSSLSDLIMTVFHHEGHQNTLPPTMLLWQMN